MKKTKLLLILMFFIVVGCDGIIDDDDSDLTILEVRIVENNSLVENTICVQVNIKNLGPGKASSSLLRFYLSQNDKLEKSTDICLESQWATTVVYDVSIRSLGAGEQSLGQKDVRIPPGTNPGLYRVIAEIDGQNKITEKNEGNNTLATTDVVGIGTNNSPAPDIELTNFGVGSTTVAQGCELDVTWEVKNLGAAFITEFYVGVFLTSNSNDIITISDRFLLEGLAVAGGLNTNETKNRGASYRVKIPVSMSAGDYHLGVVADYMNQISETDESNNYPPPDPGDADKMLLLTITVTAPGASDKADIELLTANIIDPVSGILEADPSADITIQYQIRNNEANLCPGFPVGFYFSQSAILDMTTDRLLAIDTQYWEGLAASESPGTRNFVISAPGKLAIAGNYNIYVVVDPNNQVAETSEINNTLSPLSLTITCTASGTEDASVSNLSDANPPLGEEAIITYDVDFTAGFADVIVGFYITPDVTEMSDAIEVYRETVNAPEIGRSANFFIPPLDFIANQPYTFFALVDPDNALDEQFEDNNFSSAQLTFSDQIETPDLKITDIIYTSSNATADLVVVPSDNLTIDFTVLNEGNAASSPVRVGIYISSSTSLSVSDILIGILYIPALAPLETYNTQTSGTSISVLFSSSSKLYTLPLQTYYVGAIVDDLAQLNELYETNNTTITDFFRLER